MFVSLFVVWISVLPFLVWHGAYEGIKVFWFLGGQVGLIIFWLGRVLKQKNDFVFSRADVFYLLWLLVLLISSLTGVHAFESIIGGSYRHQGVIFFLGLWLVKKTFEVIKIGEKRTLYKGLGLAVIIEGLIVVYQIIFGKLYLGKPLGTLGEAGAVAGFLAMGGYFVFRSFPKAYLIIPAVSILVTQSRAGILALTMNIGLVFNLLTRKLQTPLLILSVLIAGVLVIYLSFGKGISFFENRSIIWKFGVMEFLRRPILGFGAESGEVIYKSAFAEIAIPLEGLIIDRAHNLFLDVAMWSGAIGLIFFCGWLYQSYKNLEERNRFAFFSFLIYSMLQPLSVVHWVLLAIIIGG